MANCSCCGKFVLGGTKQGNLRFCGAECHENGFLIPLAERTAPQLVERRIEELHQQRCPICHGPGPVVVFTVHTAFSMIYITTWKSQPQLSCTSCGRKAIWRGLASTAVFGWWGVPFGVVITLWQLLKNVQALRSLSDASQASAGLRRQAALEIADSLLNHTAAPLNDADVESGLMVPRRRAA